MGRIREASAVLLLLLFSFPHSYLSQQLVTSSTPASAINLTLPNREGSVRMLVFGDAGRGSKEQYELGTLMDRYHQSFQYDTVLMTGDNIYYKVLNAVLRSDPLVKVVVSGEDHIDPAAKHDGMEYLSYLFI